MNTAGGLLATWVFLAFAVERLVELLVNIVPTMDKKKVLGIQVPTLLAMTLSLGLAYGAGLDFFAMFGIGFKWRLAGPAISGLFMGGGSNLVHDIVEWVNAKKTMAKLRSMG
jgi:hypothetical protein